MFNKICEILHKIGINDEINKHDLLKDNLGLDSTEMAFFVIEIKRVFGVDIEGSNCEQMQIIKIADFVQDRMK